MAKFPIGTALINAGALTLCAECRQPATFGGADADAISGNRVLTYRVTVEPCGHQSIQANPDL